ncbi:Chromo domain-containing protein [Salix suchowensis]|nr:Chromo domain-containing protein [Salix suchowensis]
MSELHLPSPKNQLLDQAELFLQAAMPLEQQTQTKDSVQEPEIPAPGRCTNTPCLQEDPSAIRARNPKEPKDAEALTALTRSINRLRQVSVFPELSRSIDSVIVEVIVLPLYLDNKIVSLLLVFSAIGSKPLARKLSLPSNYQQSKTPVAVLLAWSLPSYERQEWRHPVNKAIYCSLPYEPPSISRAQYRKLRHLCTMMGVLRFPQDLYEFMNRATRSYCVWWEGGDGASKQQGWETDTLQTVLEACGAENGGHKKSVRVVFVHVASILTLHRLPDFLERRSKRLDVCFYTYDDRRRRYSHDGSPPLEPYFTNPRALEWRAATEAQRNFTRRDYLEYALKEFNASYSNVPESDWLITAEGAITKDLHMMQTQPCFMSEYRRFVVIRGSQESYEPDVLKDSVSHRLFFSCRVLNVKGFAV